jgi:hypothetical protein
MQLIPTATDAKISFRFFLGQRNNLQLIFLFCISGSNMGGGRRESVGGQRRGWGVNQNTFTITDYPVAFA